MRPRDAAHAGDWLYERAEEAAAAGLPLEEALQAVRDGYSSIEADRMIRAELDGDDDVPSAAMSYDAVQWRFTNHEEVLDLIGTEAPGQPKTDQTITVMTPDGIGYANRGQWIYREPADGAGIFRISDADPNS